MLEFFNLVWPETGGYLVAYPLGEGKGYAQESFESKEEAISKASQLSDNGKNAYFAVGAVDNLGRPAKRTSDNITFLRAFFLDIDCGEEKAAKGEGYATQLAAKNAIKEFTQKVGLPTPTVVNSGYGWHLYWPLTSDVSSDYWLPVAAKFKQVVRHAGLIDDPSRTADRASILRVPGTFNYKRGNKVEVKVVFKSSPIDFEQFSKIINDYVESHSIEVHQPKLKVNSEYLEILEQFGVEPNLEEAYEPADFNRIAENCVAMGYCVANARTLSEPIWRSALSIASRCIDPDTAIKMVSESHPEYSEAATAAKVADVIKYKPHTCAHITSLGNFCDGCEDRRYSPMSHGYEHKLPETVPNLSPSISIMPAPETYDEPEDSPESFEGFVPDYPEGYVITPYGLVANIRNDDEEVAPKRVTLCQYPIRFDRRMYDFKLKEDIIQFQIWLPQDKWRNMEMKLRDIVDPKGAKVCAFLASVGCLVNFKEQKHMGEFMTAYLKKVIAEAAAAKNYSQLGWIDDGAAFVLADKTIKSDGTIADSGIASTITPITRSMRKRGTLEEWLKVINTYGRNGYEPYAFGHSVAYGSLLFRFTNYEGAIVNLLGDSGSGKSTVLHTINSVFGHPVELLLQKRDNEIAKFTKIAGLHNISPCYDEISNIEATQLSELCYAISQGRDKLRGSATGGLRDDELTWCCIMGSTANHSLYERLSMAKADASAEAMRVFEYNIRTDMQIMDKQEAQKTFEPLSENYGHAGEIFVTWLVQHQEEAKARVKYWRDRFDIESNVPTRERYWSSIVGATLAGAELSAKLGLNNFKVENLYKFALSQITAVRSSVQENRKEPLDLLVDFLNRSVRSIIVVMGGTTDKGKEMSMYVTQEPSNGLIARLEIDKNLAYVSRTALRQWTAEVGGDYEGMRADLIKRKVLVNPQVDKVLSDGSKVIKSGKTSCWAIDLSHPDMSGATKLEIVRTAEENQKSVANGKPF